MPLFPPINDAVKSRLPAQITLKGTPPLIIKIRPSARARRFSLQVCSNGGEISASLPANASVDSLYDFIKEKEGWLRRICAQAIPYERVKFGARFPYKGEYYTLCPGGPSPEVTCENNALRIGGKKAHMHAHLRAFLKATAHTRLLFASEKYALRLKRSFSALTLRDPSSRWGSCSSSGRLMYSWRLIMAPDHVLEYVAAHEVAHLVHMDHSKAFWKCVQTLYPDYINAQNWLRTKGPELQKWQFDDKSPPNMSNIGATKSAR